MTRLFMVAALMFVTACSCYSGPDSEHFDGTSSFNKEPDKTFTDHIKWLWEIETITQAANSPGGSSLHRPGPDKPRSLRSHGEYLL